MEKIIHESPSRNVLNLWTSDGVAPSRVPVDPSPQVHALVEKSVY